MTVTVSIKWMMVQIKKIVFLLEKWNRKNSEWNKYMNIQTRRNPFCTYAPLYFDAFYLVLISDQSASVLQQYSLAFSELSKHLRWSLLRKQLREKVNFPLKIYSYLMISGDGSREGVLQRLTNSLTIASN